MEFNIANLSVVKARELEEFVNSRLNEVGIKKKVNRGIDEELGSKVDIVVK